MFETWRIWILCFITTSCLALAHSELRRRYLVDSYGSLFPTNQCPGPLLIRSSLIVGKSHGGSRHHKSDGSASASASSITWFQSSIKPWRRQGKRRSKSSYGNRQCPLRRRCSRRINTQSLIARRRSTGREYIVCQLLRLQHGNAIGAGCCGDLKEQD